MHTYMGKNQRFINDQTMVLKIRGFCEVRGILSGLVVGGRCLVRVRRLVSVRVNWKINIAFFNLMYFYWAFHISFW